MKTTASFAAAFATLIVLGAASAPAQYAPLPDLRTFSVVTDGVRPPSDGRIRVDAAAPDRDADGISDRHDLDMDGDGIPNALDNCPCHPNASQADLDGDGIGDLCDDDLDGDGQPNALDRHPMDARMATEVASGSARLEDVLQQALRASGPLDGNQLVRKGFRTAARPWMPVPTPVAALVKRDPAEPRTGDAPRRVASASSPSAPRATSAAHSNSERLAPAPSTSKSQEPAVSVRLEGRRATLELDSNPIGRAASGVGRWLSNAAGEVGETVQEVTSFNLDNAL